jgi:hypothetical protein
MRMRGLEPPPGCPDTDLNRARLPIPPHPRARGGRAKISHARGAGGTGAGRPPRGPGAPWIGSARFASLVAASRAPLSSRGLGRRPLMAETRVRIPVAVLRKAPRSRGFRRSRGLPRVGSRASSEPRRPSRPTRAVVVRAALVVEQRATRRKRPPAPRGASRGARAWAGGDRRLCRAPALQAGPLIRSAQEQEAPRGRETAPALLPRYPAQDCVEICFPEELLS